MRISRLIVSTCLISGGEPKRYAIVSQDPLAHGCSWFSVSVACRVTSAEALRLSFIPKRVSLGFPRRRRLRRVTIPGSSLRRTFSFRAPVAPNKQCFFQVWLMFLLRCLPPQSGSIASQVICECESRHHAIPTSSASGTGDHFVHLSCSQPDS